MRLFWVFYAKRNPQNYVVVLTGEYQAFNITANTTVHVVTKKVTIVCINRAQQCKFCSEQSDLLLWLIVSKDKKKMMSSLEWWWI